MQEWDGIIADGIKHRINSNQPESCKMGGGVVDSRGKDDLDLLNAAKLSTKLERLTNVEILPGHHLSEHRELERVQP
jgi:hypothetical protein